MTSSRLLVKICGITTVRDLEVLAGADMVGVVIGVPASPRNRTWSEARDIFAAAHGQFVTVGVLLDPSISDVKEAVKVGADLIQVHGKIPADLPASLRSRVMPSVGLPGEGEKRGALNVPLPEGVEDYPFIHLDTAHPGSMGGKGEPSDRGMARRLVENHPAVRFLLSGGLTPDNVVGAIREVCPAGVDVSTGVESSPGNKSPHKVALFIHTVRRWEARHPHA